MKQVKKFLCGVFIVCMFLSGINVAPQKVLAATTSGNDGEIHWEIKGDTLTLSAVKGTQGKMKDYAWDNESPWSAAMSSEVKNVVIDESVTKLGVNAFLSDKYIESKFLQLESMKILCNAKVIPMYFVYGQSEIDTIIIGGSIEEIEQYAFYCTCTKTLIIDKNVTQIGEINFGASFGILGTSGYATELTDVYGYSDSEVSRFVDFWNKRLSLGNEWFVFDENRDGVEEEKTFFWRPNESGEDGYSLIQFYPLTDKICLSNAKATSSISLNKGKSKTIKATLPSGFSKVTKYSGSPADVKVTYKSSNSKVATVSSSGKVTGKKKGTAKITVTMQTKGGAKKTVTTKVTVK